MRSSRLLIALALFLAAGPAFANTPGGTNCIVPSHIHLVASDGAQPAVAFGEFEVIVRDLANNPVPGASVVVDLSALSDLKLCSAQSAPGVLLDCANQRVSAIADAEGKVRVTLLGGSNGAGQAGSTVQVALIYANGTLIGTPPVSAYDLDGSAGLGGGDMSVFLGDFGSGIDWSRSDFDGSGTLGGGDLSFWLAAFGSGTQIVSCAATCP